MAAPRLSDAQKQEIVSRFRSGSGTQDLADAFGCSANTIIRIVKAALEPAVYEELKRRRARRSGGSADSAAPSASQAELSLLSPEPAAAPDASRRPDDEPPAGDRDFSGPDDDLPAGAADDDDEGADDGDAPTAREGAMELAIDDADDFDGAEDDDATEEEDPDGDDSADGDFPPTFVEVPVSLQHAVVDQPLTTPRPWSGAEIPSSVYMLVDKTVELQARPLGEIPELGRLAPEELELQALVLYSNPRQAKRQCGRTQRVIKLPDTAIFERTAPYLLKQGIQRLVIEGSLYALPPA